MILWTSLRSRTGANLAGRSPNSDSVVPPSVTPPRTVSFTQRKIHPDQNALAEELDREREQEDALDRPLPISTSHSPQSKSDTADQDSSEVPIISLKPRPRRQSQGSNSLLAQSPISQGPLIPTHSHEANDTNPSNYMQAPQERVQDSETTHTPPPFFGFESMIPISRTPSRSSSSISKPHKRGRSFSYTNHTPESSSSKQSPARPPSAWQSTFGLSKSRKIIPRLVSFTKSSTSPSTISSAHNTVTDSVPPSPSSFVHIFGSKQTTTQGLPSPVPPMPTLSHPAFEDAAESAQRIDTSPASRPRKPMKARRWKSRPRQSTEVDHDRLDIQSEVAEDSHASRLGSPFSFRLAKGDAIQLPIASSSRTRLEDIEDSKSLSDRDQDRGMSRDHRGLHPGRDASASSAAALSPLSYPSIAVEEPKTPESGSKTKGKRKADELGGEGHTPPDVKKERQQQRATFAADPRPHRESGTSRSSHAPSSYTRKRARLSGANATTAASIAEALAAGHSEPGTSNLEAPRPQHGMGSVASRSSAAAIHRSKSRTSNRPPSRTDSKRTQRSQDPSDRADRRRTRSPSLSQASIPLSALISPHAPSISRSGIYHMRDPRKPPKVQTTPWSLSFPDSDPDHRSLVSRLVARLRGNQDPTMDSPGWTERGGSPIHAWMFFIGFILFPLWWIASFLPIPRTRRLSTDAEQGGAEKVILDDPQIESDARSWRNRCRVLGGVSLFTYIPFIVCVAIFA